MPPSHKKKVNAYLPFLTLALIFIFISNYAGSSIGSTYTDNHDSKDDFLRGLGKTPLIYHPCKREEIWRFFTYMLLHADPIHLGFNVGLQLLVGESFYKFLKLENSTNHIAPK